MGCKEHALNQHSTLSPAPQSCECTEGQRVPQTWQCRCSATSWGHVTLGNTLGEGVLYSVQHLPQIAESHLPGAGQSQQEQIPAGLRSELPRPWVLLTDRD